MFRSLERILFLSESSTRLLIEDWKETQLEFYQEEQREQDQTRDQKSAGSGAFIISYLSIPLHCPGDSNLVLGETHHV